jgi:hypothetical protein
VIAKMAKHTPTNNATRRMFGRCLSMVDIYPRSPSFKLQTVHALRRKGYLE